MALVNKEELFDVIIDRVKEAGMKHGHKKPQAFAYWFAEMYYLDPHGMVVSDGSHDGKVDFFFTTNNGKTVKHHVINSKFTDTYNKLAPPIFYEEIAYFVQAFKNVDQRDTFLLKSVKEELRAKYSLLFERYDEGEAELIFITNCRRNDGYESLLKDLPVKVFHLEDLVQHLIDDLDATMPRTPDLVLNDIHTVLSADKRDSSVSTSIVFARLIDFISYMKKDPYDLLFARNVRVSFGVKKHSVNGEIQETFDKHPEEFVFSNNGITVLCEDHDHKPGATTLVLVNPRVVNGSQTLHSIRDVAKPSSQARVMVRIIEIPPITGENVAKQIENRRDVLNKISVRSNRQNPIKKWDLVSNDDFQLEVYRLFRRKGFFYERRIREWNQRSRELKSVQIQRGINIKNLTQYIVSYHWNKPKLGPAVAKATAGELFEGEIYDQVQKTSPETAYQIYQVSDIVQVMLNDLKSFRYINTLKPNVYLVLFSVVVKALQEVGVKWGSPEFTEFLEEDEDISFSSWFGAWRKIVKEAIDHINKIYKADVKRALKHNDDAPTIRNYFINNTSISGLLKKPLPASLKKAAKQVIAS
jgi:AIPR protein